MIQIKNVSKTYGKDLKAVDNITLNIESGVIYGFLGPNGAGKTTTIKMITGIIKPDEGTIDINGYEIQEKTIEAKMQIGFVSDDPNIFIRLKGIEYLNFMADIYDVQQNDRHERIKLYAKMFEMENALGDKIQSYSHGMRQKIVIMGALVHNPSVWMLDEPMTGLDPKSSYQLKEMMRKHVDAGNTVFFSTHVLEVAEKVCDRVAVIDKGKILFEGTLDMMRNISDDKSLEDMFLELTQEGVKDE